MAISTYDVSNVNEYPAVSTDSNVSEYFANKPRKDIGLLLIQRIDGFYNFIQTSGKLTLWRRCYDYYYHGLIRGARLRKTGKEDEFTTIHVNHYRNILQHLLIGVTQTKPTFEPQAANTDYKSQSQAIVANGVIEYYNRYKRMDRISKRAAEESLIYGEAWVSLEWDTTMGENYGLDDRGAMQKDGDIRFSNFAPIDVVIDYTIEDPKNHNWMITRKFENKYVMAAKYPDYGDRIINLSISSEMLREKRWGMQQFKDTDLIPVWTFYHKANAAVPEGRMTEFMASDIITIDGPLPYRNIPLYRMAPEEQIKTPFGYTIGFDLLPIQEASDALYSTVMTNQSTFGVQNIAMPNNSDINVTALVGGLNLVTYDPKFGKPEPMNLTSTPPEVFKFIEQLENRMETIAGVNSVVRGNPEASLKSGAALALVAAQSIQFNSGFQQSYTQLLEDMATALVQILQDYAKTPRIALISGKANRPYMNEFTGEDLSQIHRVTVNVGNPLSQTTAGKLEIANSLLQAGQIKNPEQYIQIASTGRLEPLIENQQAQIMLVRSENEKLQEGTMVQAMITDDHALHIKEHGVVLASPESRLDPQVVMMTTQHIQEHIGLLQTGNPIILSLNQQPMIPQVPPAPGGPAGAAPDVMNATNPLVEQAQGVNLPKQPKNPLTGERFQPGVG